MTLIPSPHRVQVRRYLGTANDPMGNSVPSLDAPVDWWVRSIDPASSRDANQANRDMTTIAYVIQADKTSAVPGYRDVVLVDGVEYPVDGTPDDWTRGPWFNPVAGVTVYLTRVEG